VHATNKNIRVKRTMLLYLPVQVVSRTPRLRRLVEDILAETAAETGAALRLHAIAARAASVTGAAKTADGAAEGGAGEGGAVVQVTAGGGAGESKGAGSA